MTTSTQSTSPDLNTIASWAQSDYTLLTASFINAMTTEQLQAMLHPEWVPVTVLAALPAATLNTFTTTQFQALTTDQLNTIPTAVLPSLDNSHIAALTADQVAAFTHITSLTSAQFGQLNLTAVAATTMAKWSKTNWAGLTAAQVSLFSIAQISSFKSASYLPAAAAAGLLPEQMAPLSSSYSQFSADWFNHVPIASFQALDKSRLSAISAATWAQIDLAHFCALNASQISAIKLDFSTLSVDWINSLSAATFQGLTTTQLGLLSATTIAALSDSNLAALTATQLPALKDLTLLSGHQFSLLSLPAMSTTQIAAWTPEQYAALTITSFSTLSTKQIGTLTNPGILPQVVVNALTAAQVNAIKIGFSQLPASWFDMLSTTTLQGVNATQLGLLTGATIAALGDSSLTAFTATQLPALKDLTLLNGHQFSLLSLPAMSAAQIAAWTPEQYAALTTTSFSTLSTTQIGTLTNPDILPQAVVSALTAAQVNAIKIGFSQLPASWFDTLSTTTLQGLNATQLGLLTGVTIAALGDSSLTAFTATQLPALKDLTLLNGHQFSLLSLSAMSAAQIAAWTPEQYAALTTTSFSTLSTAQIGALTNPASLPLSVVSALTVAQVNAINTDFSQLPDAWLNSLSTTALQGLTPWQFSHLSSLTPAEVNNITSLAALSSAQFSQLNLTGLSTSAIASWSYSDYSGLTAQQIASLSTTQVHAMAHADWMPAPAAAGFSPEQLASINISFSWFSSAWLNNLTVTAFQSLSATHLSQISSANLSGVDAAHLTALSAAQVASMTNLGSMASAKFSLLDISALSESQCAALTATQYQGLTQTQLSSLSSTQQLALAHPEWLAPGLINILSVAQFASLSATQFAAMTPVALCGLDAAHFAVYGGNLQLQSNDTLLVLAPRLTSGQMSGLTAAQQALITASVSGADSLIAGLTDPTLKGIMQQTGGSLLFSYNGIESVLKGFNAAMNGPLTADQYADLTHYVQSIGSVLGTNSSTYAIMNALVSGANGASVNWTSPTDGTDTRIGSLTVGADATQLNRLIATWLDGSNDPVGSSTSNTAGRQLYGNGSPNINDIHQYHLYDCSLLSSLQTVVNVSPDFIKSMIVQNANDSYSVRFFKNGVADWVTVDANACGYGAYDGDSSWGAILERAIVNFDSTYNGIANSYDGIKSANSTRLTEITGDTDTSYVASSTAEAVWNSTVYSALKAAVLAGEPTSLTSWEGSPSGAETHFISAHAFAITAYDAATDKFVVTNPWGAANSGNTFEATMDELWQHGHSSIDIVNSSNATGVIGQLVTAMAVVVPAPAAATTTDAAAPSAAVNPNLVVSHT